MSGEKDAVLYLFNSGYRAGYIENVVRTMFLPDGCSNEYRYTTQRNIGNDLLGVLPRLNKNTRVLMVFIDRFAEGGYRFVPLRLARFLATKPEGDQMFFSVQLGDWISPRDLVTFNDELRAKLQAKGLPQLTANDPKNENDGNYAILAPDVLGNSLRWDAGNSAWSTTVDSLYGTRAFPLKGENVRAFSRCRLLDSSEREPSTRIRKNKSCFRLLPGKGYAAEVYYKFNGDSPRDAGLSIGMAVDENARAVGQQAIQVDMRGNRGSMPFRMRKYPDDSTGAIRLQLLRAMKVELEFAIQYYLGCRVRNLIGLGLLAVLFGAFTASLGVDFSKYFSAAATRPADWGSLLLTTGTLQAVLLRFLAGLCQFAVILGVLRISGKKLV